MRRRFLLTLVPFLMGEKCFEDPVAVETAPDAPTIGTATAGNASADISFTAPANTGSKPITGYVVSCSAQSAPTVNATGPASPITVSGLTNGTTYSCTVSAVSDAGTSDPSGAVGVTPSTVPGAPTIGAVTPATASAIVNFTAPTSNGGAAITGYTATCTPTGGAGVTGTGTASPITVSGLTNGTQYGCSVIATNARGNSAASSSVNVTPANAPGAPTIGAATPGNGQASIAFTAPASDGGSAITTYAAVCTANGQPTAQANGAASPITVTGMTNGVQYACNVRAANGVGAGAASADVNVTPVGPPGAPTIGTATPGNASASIAFTAPSSNGGSAITGYTATCTPAGGTGGTGTASPLTVSNLPNGTAYSCNVKATNAVGTGSASANVSVTPRTVPGAPTIGTATPGNTQATIAFTAPASNGGSAITGYTATCTAAGETTRTGTGTTSPITVSSLTNSVQYSCSVTATNAAGVGAASSSATVTPVAPTSTSSVMCPYSHTGTNAVSGFAANVSWTCTTSRTMTSTQIPDYPAAKSYAGNPNEMGVQTDPAVTFTLTPSLSGATYSNNVHIIGWAKNGVKFDPATAEICPTRTYCTTGNGAGATYGAGTTWNVEAIGQTLFSAGVDNANGHNQPGPNNSTIGGAYHYHGMPNKYLSWLSSGRTDTSATPAVQHYLVGFALDGFPIYAKYGYADPMDATSTVREIVSSYKLKTTPDAGRPSTSIIAMGTFTQDWVYDVTVGDHLDECNGRFGKTPEFPNGIYHYYITNGYPYIQRCFKGVYP